MRRVCANCHGTRDQPGSLPSAPRFATAALKNGSDPYQLYRTITDGFGQMAPSVLDGPTAEVRRHPLHPRKLPQTPQPDPVRSD